MNRFTQRAGSTATRLLPISVALIMMAAMWSYYWGVVIPAELAYAATTNSPRGNLSDLYPRWLGARELILHERDPYSTAMTADMQRGVWGRTVDARSSGDPTDESRFAYPLYVVFLLAPTVTLPFELVQALFVVIAVGLSIASVWLWLRSFGEPICPMVLAVVSTLVVGSYPFVQALRVEQLGLIVAALIAGTMAAVATDKFWAAGIMLALAMIKPHVALPVAAWLLLWTFSKWPERRTVFVSFTATMVVLVVGAEVLLPGWIWKWREGAAAYMRYATLPPAQVQLMLGRLLGGAAAAALILAVAVVCWRARYDSASTERFKFVLPLMLTTYLIVSPIWHNYDHVLLLPAALLAFHWRAQFFGLRPFAQALVSLSAVTLAWQWVAALAVSMTALVSPATAQSWQILPWLSILLVPTSALISLILLARIRFSGAGSS